MFVSYLNRKILLFIFSFLSLLPFDFNIIAAESVVSQNLTSFNYTSAHQDLITLANQGDAVAQFMLGAKYLKGIGVKKDGRKAFEWFQKSADQGLAAAQFSLGKMYTEGKDIEKSDKTAFEWFQKAAKQGHMESQFFLGKMYLEGRSVKKDERKAFDWFQKAANEGHGGAQFFLGKMYADGIGVEKNEKKALEWLRDAAEQKFPADKSSRMPEAKGYSTVFKKLLQSFLPKEELSFDANVRHLSSFRDVLPLLENLPSDALVLFDLDDTLVVYRDVSLPPALADPLLVKLIKNLQNKGIMTIGLTKSDIADYPQKELRYHELLQANIDFSKSFQDAFVFNNFPAFGGHYPLLSKGIIYTNSISKGEVLSVFLDKMSESLKPSIIIFFDDRLKNVLDVKKAAEERNIKYIGFFYNKIFEWLDAGMSYQEIQENLLCSHEK